MGLQDRLDVTANNLPYGLQRRLEITRALALDPKLLLLDEPAAGMNPDETEDLMRLIGEIRDKFGLSILVIEHHMDLIMGVCEKLHVLNFGCTLASGSPDVVANDPAVVEAYLGGGEKKSC
jgi:branched-chain amino acid transport system ATP-binding protein